MITLHKSGWLLPVALMLLAACNDPFDSGSSIQRMRLLGGRVNIDNDAERAWVRPGDAYGVKFALVFADPKPGEPVRAEPINDVRSMFLTCTKVDIGTGQAQCAEVLFMLNLYARYQAGEFDLPDGGMPAGPIVSQEDIDKTFEALRLGVGCSDQETIGNANAGIRQITLNEQAPRLVCSDFPSAQEDLASNYTGGDRLVQGVICEYGEPIFQLDPPYFGCRYEIGSNAALPDRAPITEIVGFTTRVEQDGLTNQHPKFELVADDREGAPAPLRVPFEIAPVDAANTNPEYDDWNPLLATASVDDNCTGVNASGVVPVKAFGEKSSIRIPVEAMRELISTDPERREIYQIEHFTTFGKLERQFSIIDDLDTEPVAEVEWEHGAQPEDDEGNLITAKRVQFYFLIRDGRGGFVIDQRSACVCVEGRCPTM